RSWWRRPQRAHWRHLTMDEKRDAGTMRPPIMASMGQTAPLVEVVIEVPRGSFLKRGSLGHVDFVSPLPCPYNYGSVPTHIRLEGDLLGGLVLGARPSPCSDMF